MARLSVLALALLALAMSAHAIQGELARRDRAQARSEIQRCACDPALAGCGDERLSSPRMARAGPRRSLKQATATATSIAQATGPQTQAVAQR